MNGALVGAGDRFRRDVVDLEAGPRRGILFEVRGDEPVAYRDTHGLGASGQRQQQRDLVGEFGGGRDLALREAEGTIIGRMPRKLALPVIEGGRRAQRVALQFDGHGRKRQPAGNDAVGLGGRFQRLCMLRGVAQFGDELVAAGTQARGIRQIAFALDERPGSVHGVTGQERALTADVPVILGEIRRRRHGDGIELLVGAGAVVFCEGDFGGDQRPRGGQFGARVRRNRRQRLPGLSHVTCGNPLLRAQQFIAVVIRRRCGGELRVGPGGIDVFALAGEFRCVGLPVGGGFEGLDQGAGGGQQREDYHRAERQPWTSRDRCHTLRSLNFAYRRGL